MSCANNLTIYKGEYKALRVTVLDPNEAPVDLTLATVIEFEVKPAAGDADAAIIISKALGTGITIEPQSGDTLGQFVIQIQPSDTALIAEQAATYDIVAVIDGKRRLIVKPSEIRIRPAVNLL